MCPFFEKNPNSCPSVGWLFNGVQGLNVHISCAHKAEHLAALEAKTSQSAPLRTWSNEEIRFLAHAEFERRRDMMAMMARSVTKHEDAQGQGLVQRASVEISLVHLDKDLKRQQLRGHERLLVLQ